MKTNKPYVYLLGWTKLNIWYYGLEVSEGCNPDTLYKTFFTNSRAVKNFRFNHGRPDVIKIRKTFDTEYEALRYAQKTIRRMRITEDKRWLNRVDNGKGIAVKKNTQRPVDERVRISITKTGLKQTEEHTNNIRLAALKRLPYTEETRKKCGDARRGHKHTEETKARISAKMVGKRWTQKKKD